MSSPGRDTEMFARHRGPPTRFTKDPYDGCSRGTFDLNIDRANQRHRVWVGRAVRAKITWENTMHAKYLATAADVQLSMTLPG